MKVAIDGRRLQDRPWGGVGRYLAHVVPRVAAEIEVVVLTDARRPPPVVDGLDGLLRPLTVPPRLPETFWLHGAVPMWLRHWNGLFHGTYNAVPLLGGGRTVVTIHDLSWEHHDEDFRPLARRVFQLQGRASARSAKRILTPADVVRQDVARTYGVDPRRIIVSANAVDPIFGAAPDDEIAATLAILGVTPPYVVAMGGAPRRALPVAVDAWQASGAPELGYGLVVTGSERPAMPASSGDPGITWVGRVPDATWAALLAGASAFCYPTRFEGFGMPGLEAAASGTPVVCARIPSLVEILGEAAEWCPRPVVEDIAAGLRRVLSEPGRRDDLAALGLERAAAAPDWDDAAEAALRAYREASSSP